MIWSGCVLVALGVGAYLAALMQAGPGAGILDAFMSQGVIGSIAAALLATGVMMWMAGNFAVLYALLPPSDDQSGDGG